MSELYDIDYQMLIEHIPAITYIAAWDEHSSTVYVSPQIDRLLGFSQAEWRADPLLWLKQIHPDDRDYVLDELRRVHAGGKPRPCEYRMLTRACQVRWFRDDSAIRYDGEDRPLFIYGVMLDITQQKRIEADLVNIEYQLSEHQKPRLSERELLVLQFVRDGWTEYETAESLGISERTIRNCLKGIRDKLGVKSRLEAVREAIRLGLLQN